MGEKLDEHLTEQLESIGGQISEKEVSVIVTTRSKTDIADLVARGLTVAHVYKNILAVSGQIRLSDLAKLEAFDQVEKIEFDSQMHALKG